MTAMQIRPWPHPLNSQLPRIAGITSTPPSLPCPRSPHRQLFIRVNVHTCVILSQPSSSFLLLPVNRAFTQLLLAGQGLEGLVRSLGRETRMLIEVRGCFRTLENWKREDIRMVGAKCRTGFVRKTD